MVVVLGEGAGIVLFWGKRLKLRCYPRNFIAALNVCISTNAWAVSLCTYNHGLNIGCNMFDCKGYL